MIPVMKSPKLNGQGLRGTREEMQQTSLMNNMITISIILVHGVFIPGVLTGTRSAKWKEK